MVFSTLFSMFVELTMHIFVHYTVPGAQFAAGLASSLAPIMDSLGITTFFSEAGTEKALELGASFGEAAGETTTAALEAGGSVAGGCQVGGFCPIHNTFNGVPLTGSFEDAVAPLSISSDLEGLPALDSTNVLKDDPLDHLKGLPQLDYSLSP